MCKVLIVEDEIITGKSLFLDLKDSGVHALKPVLFGEEAVEVALQEKPHLILMDIRLAGLMNGIEAAEKIVRHIKTSIVFMTGYATDTIKEQAQKVHPVAFLDKPVNVHDILEIIKDLEK